MTLCKGDDVMDAVEEEMTEIEEVQRVAYWLAVMRFWQDPKK